MKILFVSTSQLENSASSNMRNIALLKGLIENGHTVSTLTPSIQKDSQLYDDSLLNIKFEKRYFIDMGLVHSTLSKNNVKKNKLKLIVYNFLKKIKIYDFRDSLAKKNIIIKEKFDIMISSSDPKSSHLLAKKLIERNPDITKRWIQYWGDPFYDDINDKRKLIKFFIKREETNLIKYADKVIYVSPFTLEKQKNIYLKFKNKMFFLPIPFNETIFYENKRIGKLKLGYFGDYYSRNRNIVPLYDTIRSNENVELIICGNSDLTIENTDNIKIYERQQLKKMREYEANSDVLVCICNKNGTQIPGKVYHYAATNKPILVIVDGELQESLIEYFKGFDRYILCYNKEEDINNTLNEIMNSDKKYSPCKKLEASNIATEFIE